MESNSNIVGGAIELPYHQSFDDEEDFGLMKVIDANKDGITWIWNTYGDDGVASIQAANSDYYGTQFDDLLLTPEIKLEAGKRYKVSVRIRCAAWLEDNDRVAITYGEGEDYTKYASAIPTVTINYFLPFQTVSGEFESTSDRNVRFAFHRTVANSTRTMMLDDIKIEALAPSTVPAMPKDLTVVAAEKGELKATAKFTLPSKTKEGDTLEDITSAIIYCDDNKVAEITNVAPGKECEAEVNVPSHGTHTFSVSAVNSDGESDKANTECFVGTDVPGRFKAWISDERTSVTVKWDSCEKGLHGYYVNPEKMTYSIYMTDGTYRGDLVASGITGNEYTLNLNTENGSLSSLQLIVTASNEAGEGTSNMTKALIIGPSYNLPYEEHFNPDSQYIYLIDSSGSFNFAGGISSDGDAYNLTWLSSMDSSTSHFIESLKIALTPDMSQTMVFDYRLPEGASIEVDLIRPDGTIITAAEITEPSESAWMRAEIDLSPIKGDRYFRFAIRLNKGQSEGLGIFIDNLHVMDSYNRNLSAAITMPENKIRFGQYADISVKVINRSINASDDYKVILTADGTQIGEQTGESIAMAGEKTHHFSYQVKPGSPEVMNIEASIEYEGDEVPDDNIANGRLIIQNAKVSAPENLNVYGTEEAVKLEWTAPTKFYTEKVIENFEDYSPWTITNFVEWKVIDADNAPVIGLEQAEYPNKGVPQAFTIFNPSSVGMPEGNTEGRPYSGYQYLVSFAADVNKTEHNDDWIISPVLSGEAQTIQFYAKEMTPYYGAEKIEVLTSYTGTEIDDFTLIEEFDITNYQSWKRYTVDLPEGSMYFAIRVVTRDGHIFMLDDITFIAGSCHEIVNWRIYRDGEFIAEIPVSVLTYNDENIESSHKYNVTAVYATGEESNYSETAMFTPAGLNSIEFHNSKYTVVTPDGKVLRRNADNCDGLEPGIYIINGKKVVITK